MTPKRTTALIFLSHKSEVEDDVEGKELSWALILSEGESQVGVFKCESEEVSCTERQEVPSSLNPHTSSTEDDDTEDDVSVVFWVSTSGVDNLKILAALSSDSSMYKGPSLSIHTEKGVIKT